MTNQNVKIEEEVSNVDYINSVIDRVQSEGLLSSRVKSGNMIKGRKIMSVILKTHDHEYTIGQMKILVEQILFEQYKKNNPESTIKDLKFSRTIIYNIIKHDSTYEIDQNDKIYVVKKNKKN